MCRLNGPNITPRRSNLPTEAVRTGCTYGVGEELFNMEGSSPTVIEPRSVSTDHPDMPVACIDLDRFCEDCAYNLRTLPVHRDPHTGIPIVRCPECGRLQPANNASTALRPWLNRATSLLLGLWVLTVGSLFALGVMGEVGISYATLDEFTHHSGGQIQRISTTTIRTYSSFGPLEVAEAYPGYKLVLSLMLGTSLLLGLVLGTYLVVVAPHWSRAAYMVVAISVPLLVGLGVGFAWSREAPHLFGWGMLFVMTHTAAQLLGWMLGVTFGRPIARLTVRIVLPPGIRPRLAYLWHADRKAFPRPV